MFRTREDFRFYVPRDLLGGDDSIAHYRIFERLLNLPLFMVSVLAAEDADARWQTFFLQEVPEVTQLVAMEIWSAHKIYVILPERVTGQDRQIMALCSAIWSSVRGAGEGPAWIFETDHGSFQHGANEEDVCHFREKTLQWSQVLPESG